MPATGTVTDGGTFSFSGVAAGNHTLTVIDDSAPVAGACSTVSCQIDIPVQAYDAFNIAFNHVCQDNAITVADVTGGQDPRIFTAGTEFYDVTIAGSTEGTQQFTAAGGFPMTFTGLAEGTYDITVVDAVGCSITFQAEAYDPIVLTDNSDRCDAANTGNVTVDGGQPDHPGTTDIATGANGAANGTTAYSFTDYSVISNIDGALNTAPDAAGLWTDGTLSCGTHSLRFEYTLLDDSGVATAETCSESINVDVYDELTATVISSACGEVDVTAISGGWDPNCANGYTPAPPGYTVVLEGPSDSSIAGSASYTLATSPISSVAGVEFTAGDASGVPPNGLPGGSYTVTITDGRNDACPLVIPVTITGCCPAASDVSGDFQLCGFYNLSSNDQSYSEIPGLNDGSNSIAYTAMVIDPNTTLTLNTQDAGSGADTPADGIDWFYEVGAQATVDPLSSTPYSDEAMVARDNCFEEFYTVCAYLRCDGNHDGAFNPTQAGAAGGTAVGFDPTTGGNATDATSGEDSYIAVGCVSVTVWPELYASIGHPPEDDPLDCRVEIIPSCADDTVLDIQFSADVVDVAFGTSTQVFPPTNPNLVVFDAAGGRYIIDPDEVFAPAASIGDIYVTMTNLDADPSIGETCQAINIGPEDYKCCIAESGEISATKVCPPPSVSDEVGNDDTILYVTIDQYEDFELYVEYMIVVDDQGIIVDVIDLTGAVAPPPANVNLPDGDANANPIPSIPTGGTTSYTMEFEYAYWDNLLGVPDCTTGTSGLNVTLYSYNDFNILTSLDAQNGPIDYLGQPVQTLIEHSSDYGILDVICADISEPLDVFIPSPFEFECGTTNSWEGEQGNILPFYYNYHTGTICGGTRPYEYDWERTGYVRWDIEHGPIGDEINIYYADNAEWSFTVTDANGCTIDPDLHCTNDSNGDVNNMGVILDIESVVIKGESYSSYTSGSQTGDGSITIEPTGCSDGGYQYSWSGPGGYTSSVQNPQGLESGHYEVTITCPADGETTEGFYWVPLDRRSGRLKVGDSSELQIDAFPNPMEEFATVEFVLPEDGEVTLEIFGTDAKLMASSTLGRMAAGKVHQYPISSAEYGLSSGTYLLKVSSDADAAATMQLVVVR